MKGRRSTNLFHRDQLGGMVRTKTLLGGGMGALENGASVPEVSAAEWRKKELKSPGKIKDSQQNNYKEAMSLQLDCLHK